jgi:hypothetical protein
VFRRKCWSLKVPFVLRSFFFVPFLPRASQSRRERRQGERGDEATFRGSHRRPRGAEAAKSGRRFPPVAVGQFGANAAKRAEIGAERTRAALPRSRLLPFSLAPRTMQGEPSRRAHEPAQARARLLYRSLESRTPACRWKKANQQEMSDSERFGGVTP